MELSQNQLEHIMNQVELGNLSNDAANVEIVRAMRVRLVLAGIPRKVRAVLNSAVKAGKLGHVKKDGHKPEAYFHPKFEYLVNGERNKREREIQRACMMVCG
jgi:hypothetical protein